MINYRDDAYMEMIGALKSAWKASLPKLKRPEVDASWARGRRREFVEGRLAEAKKRLMELRLERGRLSIKGDDTTAAFLGPFEVDAASQVYKLTEQLERLNAPEPEKSSRISDDAIRRARGVRLGALLGLDEKKKIACPFHGEDRHPSASISKGFFKCFTCGKGPLDGIDWLMEVEGYTFPAAIKRLEGIA